MATARTVLLLALAIVGGSALAPASAQTTPPLKVPQSSPAAAVTLDVGTTTIEIRYHRPALRGRDVWKDFGATDVVWRLGANEATTITFSDPVRIAGKEVPAGTYALFAKVGTGGTGPWTLLLNKNSKQWGAYYHDDQQDLLRFEAKPVAAPKREWFAIALDPKDDRTATVTIAWDALQVAFDVAVDVDANVARGIERTLKQLDPKDWDTRLVIVKYWVERKERLEEALTLIEEAVALEANFWTLEWNARTLHALGETEPALPLLERAIADAKGKTPQGYVDGLTKLLAEWQRAE
jgi:hypothetical protein